MELEPLLGVDQPELILSICASDGAATGEFIWTAYAAASDVTVPDAPRSSTLDSDLQGFVTEMRQTVSQTQGPYEDYLSLAGKARRMGRAVPDGIQAVVREGRRGPGAHHGTDDPAPDRGGDAAVGARRPRPTARQRRGAASRRSSARTRRSHAGRSARSDRARRRKSAVAVKRAAVLTADYTGVMGWGELKDAQEEADFVTTLFTSAFPVTPSLGDVIELLSGNPTADVLHVALHGQFDAQGDEGGLVLLAKDEAGNLTTRAQFLKPDQVLNGRLDNGPFVFLNACQVGSDKRVLADNGGFASTLLQIGATGVVAPLWNVNDVTAAECRPCLLRRDVERDGRGRPAPGLRGGGGSVAAREVHPVGHGGEDPRRRRDADRLPGVRPPAAAARPRVTRPSRPDPTHEGARWLRTCGPKESPSRSARYGSPRPA